MVNYSVPHYRLNTVQQVLYVPLYHTQSEVGAPLWLFGMVDSTCESYPVSHDTTGY